MISFCGPQSIPANGYTNDELKAVWSTTKNILPSTMPQFTNGMADTSYLKDYIKGLIPSRVPSNPDPGSIQTSTFDAPNVVNPLADFVSKEADLISNIKQEYCFYESRYFFALDSLLNTLADTTNITKTDTLNTANTKLETVRLLNTKLSVLTQIVNEISNYRSTSSIEINSQITTLNNKFQQTGLNLSAQNALLNSETAAADLHKKMVEYTIEKNKAHQNLLSLFAVLNVTALAMLFYVARS